MRFEYVLEINGRKFEGKGEGLPESVLKELNMKIGSKGLDG